MKGKNLIENYSEFKDYTHKNKFYVKLLICEPECQTGIYTFH